MANLVYVRTAERPDLKLWIEDDDGALIDFSSGYTFAFKLGHLGAAAVFTKTTGITGAAGSGTAPSGTPNVTITFSAAELDSVTAGKLKWQLRATTGGLDRVYQGDFVIRDVIT
jgi:hypothetical protein